VSGPIERLRAARGILVDLDGTLIIGEEPAPGARRLLAERGDMLAVVSNYSTMTSLAMAARLARMGLDIAPERFCLAGERAIARLAVERPAARVLCLMTAPMRALAEAHGLTLAEDDVDVVLVGRDLDFSYARLERAVRALHFGAGLIVTNLDPTHPGVGQVPVPETGSILAALLAGAPGTRPRVIGKPQPELFLDALRLLGVAPGEALMIGDSPDADLAGASAAGIGCLLVGATPGADAPNIAALLASASDRLEILK
jgi:HAD superfamily hydrolase (TIGR01450 family)